jgi:hypothetical protein
MANGIINKQSRNDDNVLSDVMLYRILLNTNQSITLTEGTAQRFAIIIVYNSNGSEVCGIYVVDRWGNLHPIHRSSDIEFSWTGAVNVLGTLTITNKRSSGFVGIAVMYPPNVYSEIHLSS